jgi:hypothetical protein
MSVNIRANVNIRIYIMQDIIHVRVFVWSLKKILSVLGLRER